MLEELKQALGDLIQKGNAVVPLEAEDYVTFILDGEGVAYDVDNWDTKNVIFKILV